MNRLITFGCSLTYGHGLPDCVIDGKFPGPVPSSLAWPKLISEMMNRECVNMAKPGSSNDKIMHAIINFENFTKDDHVIILWSFVHRGMILRSETEKIDIMPHPPASKKSSGTQSWERYWPAISEPAGIDDWELFHRIHNDYDMLFRTIKNMHHAYCYFATKQVTVSNFYVDRTLQPTITTADENVKNMLVDAHLIDQRKIIVDTAIDRLHPGIRTHKKMADLIYKIHKEKHEH
jgi:hypothetical protein